MSLDEALDAYEAALKELRSVEQSYFENRAKDEELSKERRVLDAAKNEAGKRCQSAREQLDALLLGNMVVSG